MILPSTERTVAPREIRSSIERVQCRGRAPGTPEAARRRGPAVSRGLLLLTLGPESVFKMGVYGVYCVFNSNKTVQFG